MFLEETASLDVLTFIKLKKCHVPGSLSGTNYKWVDQVDMGPCTHGAQTSLKNTWC